MNIQTTLQEKLGKEIAQASNEEIYDALLSMVQEMAGEKERTDSKKKLYYISAEFLIGKLLSNNMINLGIFNEVKDVLAQNGKNIAEIEEVEPEPSLGNGGLGRLAACFLDSIATLGLGINKIWIPCVCGEGLVRGVPVSSRSKRQDLPITLSGLF